jgi:hypothetical protein
MYILFCSETVAIAKMKMIDVLTPFHYLFDSKSTKQIPPLLVLVLELIPALIFVGP